MEHELDLARFAPLSVEQIFHVALLFRRRDQLDRSNPDEFWRSVALHLRATCPEREPVDHEVVRDVVTRMSGVFTKPEHKYSLFVQMFPDPWFTFMNYGYDALDQSSLALVGAEVNWPAAVALYDRVAAQADLRGRDVLEVGCGRGGGAAYLARAHGARVTAVDATASHILFCRQVHGDAVRFDHARAEALPGADGSYDAILSVESANYYEPFDSFVAGARRLLRPGGTLLLAAYQTFERPHAMHVALERGGFSLERVEDISAHVVAAMARTRQGELAACVSRNSTLRARRHYAEFLDGVFRNEDLASGRARYHCASWRRAER